MPKNTPYSELKEAIANKEKERAEKGELLKEQFRVTYESLNPITLIKSSFSNLIGSPEIRNNFLGFVIPLLVQILRKKTNKGTRREPVSKVAGLLLLEGLTVYLNQHPEMMRNIGQFLKNIFPKKKTPDPNDE